MEKGSFQKVERSSKRMYGPWKIVACGYRANEQQRFLDLLKGIGFDDLPVVFVGEAQKDMTLKELLEKPHGTGIGKDSGLRRAAILSGFTQEGIHKILSEYRKSGFPAQLWATLTPISEKWKICKLLEELQKEAEEFRKKRQG
ncbi:MAG: hypothetical protein DRG59_00650 [Deltaproteobacteria bacterium]|nr:MAG: hypothetical protein DRG83_02200 [Deltaproteobacteria bacterium]RLB10028.1 MAG: hypothetical protein DRG59_00650 [Deltaproteobacteria bacterium]